MAGIKSPHDVFECPNVKDLWHKQVASLQREARGTVSGRLEVIYREEIADILRTRQPSRDLSSIYF